MNFRHLCGSRNKTPAERFETYLMPVPEAGCFIWLGDESHNGYGRFQINNRRIPAHRYAWLCQKGEIPDGLMVCHKCDTPQCCNVEHLFLGTCKQNKADSVSKGRHSHGKIASVSRAEKLNSVLAKQIFIARGTHQCVADQFGISRAMVTKIKAKKAWAWIHTEAV